MDQRNGALERKPPPAPQPLAKVVPIAGLIQAMIEEIRAFKEGRPSPPPLAELIPMAGLIQGIIDEVRAYRKDPRSRPPSARR